MSTAYTAQTAPKALFDYDKYWASCFEPAPFLPMSREEMDQLGWDACDFILVWFGVMLILIIPLLYRA